MTFAGYVVPNLALPPLCHPQFKQGAPSEAAQTASQFLNEVIVNSGMIDLKDLCIVKGKYVWVVYVDMTCLNFAGNILDTSIKALTAALKSVMVPNVTVISNDSDETMEEEESDDKVDKDKVKKIEIEVDPEQRQPLKLGPMPLSCTMSVFGDKLLLDPTDEEEVLADASVTVVLNTDKEVCNLQKAGGTPLGSDKVQNCISLAKKHSKVIQKLIESASENKE